MKSIIVLAHKYPNVVERETCVFIQQLVWQFADMGRECVVIAPVPINRWGLGKIPYKAVEITENHNRVTVFHPRYLSAGQSGKTLQRPRVAFTTANYEKAVYRVIRKEKLHCEIIYSHFLCPAGVSASRVGKRLGIPAFMAHGEAQYIGNEYYGNDRLKKELNGLKGVIAVSSQNRDYVIQAGIVPEEIVRVFPNGYREERFFARDKKTSREKFGFPSEAFIVGMCGSFDERKGVLRLQKAVEQIPDVYFACAGKGSLMPGGERCLWAKPVQNSELSYFYSALDALVMPTTNEGCCNAIVEAIACGCPVISSDKPFNYEICDETNSILIDPLNVNEIRDAIIELKENEGKRTELSEGSIEKAKELTLADRAKKIISFIESVR